VNFACKHDRFDGAVALFDPRFESNKLWMQGLFRVSASTEIARENAG
jgi:hypothetical protein